jgi:hypothetical protein
VQLAGTIVKELLYIMQTKSKTWYTCRWYSICGKRRDYP